MTQGPTPDAIAKIIAAAGSDGFGEVVLDAVQKAGDIAEVFLFRWTEGSRAQLICVAGRNDGANARAANYVNRYFHHDPMLFQHQGTKAGSGFAETYRVGSIAPAEYQQRCFREPGFSEKHSFGWRWPEQLIIVNFYSQESGAVSNAVLSEYASLVMGAARSAGKGGEASFSLETLNRRLMAEYPTLSQRECKVVSKTITGMDSHGIAVELGIASTTVLTYRRRAYRKMGVSNAALALRQILDEA